MKYKTAINDLKTVKEFFMEESGGSYPLCLDTAITACQKQLYKKIKRINVNGSVGYMCPNCRKILEPDELNRKAKWCGGCGQALEWR